MTSSGRPDYWGEFTSSLTDVERAIGRVSAVNVNTAKPRDATRALVQQWFRRTRPELFELGLDAGLVESVDALAQDLLRLANGNNAKASYTQRLRRIRAEVQALELARELRLGEARQSARGGDRHRLSPVETRILHTLDQLVPAAGASYRQAIDDLSQESRFSYKGTANELREVVRETLDRLAPDEEVMDAPGFKLERDATKPTQKQKVRHILRSRNVPSSARRAPEDTASLIEDRVGSITRATYDRGSLAAHRAAEEREVRQLKMYVDTVLAELLQVHG